MWNPDERELNSGVIPNGVSGWARTVFRDEGKHRFRDEGEQFQVDPGMEVPVCGQSVAHKRNAVRKSASILFEPGLIA